MANKLSLLLKVLAVIVEVIKKDANERKSAFDPKPYYRIFTNILNHINSVNSILVGADLQVLASIAQSFHSLQPAKLPEFCFTWLELVTRQDFMPKLLRQDDHEGWKYFKPLLIDLLRFMEPLLRIGELTEPVCILHSLYTYIHTYAHTRLLLVFTNSDS
ncbi:uncharacterized protein LOC143601197 [Bidens hawaiensis]|uniref:uncharacterized protein LOC143601197 n=1 Tax=Bidens hawaiensis TaxID=980011 RepID=UPI00404AA80E